MKNQRRTAYDEKLEAILTAAAQVFADKGYHNASIRDIARVTGISLSGLYYYFQGKEELLYLIQDRAFGTLICMLEDRLEGIEEPQHRIRILIDNHLRYFVSNMAEMKVLAHEADSLSGNYRHCVDQKKARLTEIAMDALRNLRPDGEIDLRVATFALFGMMNWLYTWYTPERDVSLDRLVEDLTRLFIEGFLVPAGEGLATELNTSASTSSADEKALMSAAASGREQIEKDGWVPHRFAGP